MKSSKIWQRFIFIICFLITIAGCNGSGNSGMATAATYKSSTAASGVQLCNYLGTGTNPNIYLRLVNNGGASWGSYDIGYKVCGGLPNNSGSTWSSWNVYDGPNGTGNYFGNITVIYDATAKTTTFSSYNTSGITPGDYLDGINLVNASTQSPGIAVNSIACDTCAKSYSYPAIPSSYVTQKYRGVNLAGGEYDYAFQLPSLNDGAFYAQYGMNTIRLPFLWEYLQSSSTNTQNKVNDPSVAINFNNSNAKAYAALVQQYLDKGMVVILDMHNYMRYGTNQTVIGSGAAGAPTAQQYAAAWVQVGTQFKNNPNVIFDLMNEPNTMSTQLVLDNYNVVLQSLRSANINNLVLLEGNGWSGAWSWTNSDYDTASPQKSNASVFVPSKINDTMHNYAINVHQYFDSNYSGTSNTCIANSVPDISGLTNHLVTNSLQAMITELGGANTQDCANDINKFLSELSSSYMGWTGWVGGQNGMSQINYFGVLSDGSQTVTMTSGFQPNLIMPVQQ